MRPFNLKDWRSGAPVVTRKEKPVTQLTYFCDASADARKLYGVVDGITYNWTDEGDRYSSLTADDLDLFHPEEKEMYINVYETGASLKNTSQTFPTKEIALRNYSLIKAQTKLDFIGTYKLVKVC